MCERAVRMHAVSSIQHTYSYQHSGGTFAQQPETTNEPAITQDLPETTHGQPPGFDWQRRRFVGYLQIECHTGWWDELGALRGVQRAKLSVRERGCVFDFLASRGGDLELLNFEPTRLRIPSVPYTKLSPSFATFCSHKDRSK